MRQVNEDIIPVQTAATVTTPAFTSLNLLYMSAQITATGAAAGTLKMQASNDDFPNSTPPVNWSDVAGVSVVVSGAGAFLIPKTDICYQWIRFVYTNTGTGTISLVLKAQGA